MSGKINARKKGHAFELWCIKAMSDLFPEAVSARSESKRLDDAGVDICYTGDIHFQCKAVEGSMDAFSVLDRMPRDKYRVLLWKKNRMGTLAVVPLSDMKKIVGDSGRDINYAIETKKAMNLHKQGLVGGSGVLWAKEGKQEPICALHFDEFMLILKERNR